MVFRRFTGDSLDPNSGQIPGKRALEHVTLVDESFDPRWAPRLESTPWFGGYPIQAKRAPLRSHLLWTIV